MRRFLIAVVGVGALTFSVYLVSPGTVQQQAAFLNDAGIACTHVATCPVRIDPDCVARAADTGVSVKTNDRLKFPVSMKTLPDGGRDVTLPAMNQGLVRACVEVKDWTDCALATAVSAPAIAALWSTTGLPFRTTGVVKACVRAKQDAGLPCLMLDGGSFGDRNVMPRGSAANPATCESCECSIFAGEDAETDL